MATTLANMISSKVISNLDTYNYTVTTTAPHFVGIRINELPPSGITVTIQKNSVTVASTSAPAAQQQSISLSANIPCSSGDTLSIIVASSNPADGYAQVFKGTLIITTEATNM